MNQKTCSDLEFKIWSLSRMGSSLHKALAMFAIKHSLMGQMPEDMAEEVILLMDEVLKES